MATRFFTHYLEHLKEQALEGRFIVLGNSGADLDSISSALVIAWHFSCQQPQKPAVPLIACPRQDLRLRPEVTSILARAGINSTDLLFWDDIDLGKKLDHGAELALVDHNRLEPHLAALGPPVTAIIDHHHDEGNFPEASPRLIEPVGSTATLVAEQVFAAGYVPERPAALLLAGAILLDTAGLDPDAGRATSRDQLMAARLLPLCNEEQDSLYHDLHQAQYTMAGLTTTELLRRDYKEWQSRAGSYGMASVPLEAKKWQGQEPGLARQVARFAKDKGLRLLLVMLTSSAPTFQRQLILVGRQKELVTELTDFLAGQGLQLTELSAPQLLAGGEMVAIYSQGNAAMSRKKVQPLVQRFLAGE